MEQPDPVSYPRITLNNGKSFEVKFRMGDIIRLKKEHGIDFAGMQQLSGVDAFERAIKLVAAGIAHSPDAVKADELADLIDLAQFRDVSEAVNEALKKVSPQATPTTAPTVQ